MWNYKDGFSQAENIENAKRVKRELESLPQLIDGLVELVVRADALPSSNKDIILDSLFESVEALAAYQAHPEHKRVGAFVQTVVQDRVCIDYYEDADK